MSYTFEQKDRLVYEALANPEAYDKRSAEVNKAHHEAHKAAGLDANIRATIERIRKQ